MKTITNEVYGKIVEDVMNKKTYNDMTGELEIPQDWGTIHYAVICAILHQDAYYDFSGCNILEDMDEYSQSMILSKEIAHPGIFEDFIYLFDGEHNLPYPSREFVGRYEKVIEEYIKMNEDDWGSDTYDDEYEDWN